MCNTTRILIFHPLPKHSFPSTVSGGLFGGILRRKLCWMPISQNAKVILVQYFEWDRARAERKSIKAKGGLADWRTGAQYHVIVWLLRGRVECRKRIELLKHADSCKWWRSGRERCWLVCKNWNSIKTCSSTTTYHPPTHRPHRWADLGHLRINMDYYSRTSLVGVLRSCNQF